MARAAKNAFAQPKKADAVPDMKSQEAVDALQRQASETGTYELQPQVQPAAPPPADAQPDPAPAADAAPPADVEPVPDHLIRMVAIDDAVTDSFRPDPDGSGAILVPAAQVELVASLGFKIQHR